MKAIDLSGRAALVVGGGGGGIGTAMAVALAEAGADVGTITAVAEHAADTVQRVEALGRRASSVVADVTDDDALVAAIAKIGAELGTIRHLVNVVGGSLVDDWHRAVDYDMEAFDRVVGRNLRYAVLSCREVARGLVAAGTPGAIVNISSVAAKGVPLLGAYGASKAGLESFSRTMALEWAQFGIRVNLVAPGTVKTPRAGQADLPEAVKSIPLGRRGDPSDIADAALFLLSDMAAYVTGHTLPVDGGTSMGSPGGDQLPTFVTNPAIRARFDPPPDDSTRGA
jgi:NAD(P)-dependent dehydrogenase (short-subunit alcohol dehydrogenase family)